MAKKEHISYEKFSAKEKVIVVEVPDAETANPEEILEKVAGTEPEVPKAKEPRKGYPNCPMLNVRKGPGIEEGIVCVIDETVELIEDPAFENEEWCKIYTVDGIEGYCMKKFIDFK